MSNAISSNTKIKVFELCENNESVFGKFLSLIEKEGTHINQLAGAIRIIEDTANLKLRPKKQFKQLNDLGVNCKVYEAKCKDIRVYMFKDDAGRVIIKGGMKSKQAKDIKSIVKIIKAYQYEQ